jgi:uncharacterized protein involved in exopolysaccharide biosynthesis
VDDEIDLRLYVRALLRQWKLIVAVTVAAALLAAAAALLLPRTYGAVTLVSVGQPPYSLRLEGVNQGQVVPARTYPDLALSDSVITLAAQRAGELDPGRPVDARALREKLSAGPASDPTLLRLTVTDSDPQRAANLANAWAGALVEQAQLLYGPGTSQVAQYEAQLASAKADLDSAEQALAAFQAQNQAPALTAQLVSLQFSLTDYLNRQHRYSLILQDAQGLAARLEQQDAAAVASPAEQAALLILSAQASSSAVQVNPASSKTNADGDAPETEPITVQPQSIQIQVAVGGPASGQTIGQLARSVRSFIDSLQARATDAGAQSEALQPQILQVQGQLAVAQAQETNVTLARDLARDQYESLATKVDQVRIAAQDAADVVKIASAAAAPTRPGGLSRRLIVLAGTALGFALAVVLVLLREWWQAPAAVPVRVPADNGAERARA